MTPPVPFEKISPEQMTRYLKLAGWKKIKYANERLSVYCFGEQSDLVVAIPNNPQVSDYSNRLRDALTVLELVENKPVQDIAYTILIQGKDILRLRLLETSAPAFDFGSRIVEELRKVLSYGASAEEIPEPFFTQPLSSGRNFLKRCTFGHTFPGSFGFTVETDVLAQPKQMKLLKKEGAPEAPFDRLVLERVMRGLSLTNEAVAAKSAQVIVEGYKEALNGNMCLALAKMLESEKSSFECGVRWSKSFEANRLYTAPIALNRTSLPYLLEAAAKLKGIAEQPVYITLVGEVTELKEAVNEEKKKKERVQKERRIVIDILSSTEKTRPDRVRVFLRPDDYKLACDAHRDKRRITLSGQLERHTKFWYVVNPEKVRVLESI